jgi:hypothetical protein
VRRRDGTVTARRFTVGSTDSTINLLANKGAAPTGEKQAATPSAKPPVSNDAPAVQPAAAPLPGQEQLPGEAAWDLRPLQEHFVLVKANHDAKNGRLVWLAEAMWGFRYVPEVVHLEARFYDSEGASVHARSFAFEPSGGVLQDERLRISLELHDDATLERTQ